MSDKASKKTTIRRPAYHSDPGDNQSIGINYHGVCLLDSGIQPFTYKNYDVVHK